MKRAPGSCLTFRVLLALALVVITYLAVTPLTYPVVGSFNDKFNHLGAFFVLALLSDFSFPTTPFSRTKVILLLAYGALIEIVQHFLPVRFFSLFDFTADALGLGLYALALPLIRHVPGLRNRWLT